MKWLVAAPPYHQSSAGIRVLHRLAYQLQSIGEEVEIGAAVGNPDWPVPLRPQGTYPDDSIVVYPEIVKGNPFGASRVVRYVLNHPGLLGGDAFYDPSELVIAYEAAYLDSARAAGGEATICHVDVVEPHIFNRGEASRVFDAFYAGWRGKRIAPPVDGSFPMLEITASWPATRQQVGLLLQRTRTLYCCSHGTMLIDEALRCGVAVSLVEDERFQPPLIRMGDTPSKWDSTEDVQALVARSAARWAPVSV